MQFKIYDVLASLIPGTVVVGILLAAALTLGYSDLVESLGKFKDFTGILTSIFLVASYLVGYVIHALGSWIEPVLWVSWGGRPSELLLNNKAKRRGMVGTNRILDFLKVQSNEMGLAIDNEKLLKGEDFRDLFQIAKIIAYTKADGNIRERISEFNNSYIFSRNILIAMTIALAFLIVWFKHGLLPWWMLLVFAVTYLILWIRCKDKALYYSREILVAAFHSNLVVPSLPTTQPSST
jgi:hypothetical protein